MEKDLEILFFHQIELHCHDCGGVSLIGFYSTREDQEQCVVDCPFCCGGTVEPNYY